MKDKFNAFREKHGKTLHVCGYTAMTGVIVGLAYTLRDRQIMQVATGTVEDGREFAVLTQRNGHELWKQLYKIEQ